MFSSRLQPIEHYRQVGTVTAVWQASPHQLAMMLFDGAMASLVQARHALATADHDTRRSAIARAMRIIDEGLKAAVESTPGNEDLADNLRALYDYMVSRLLVANLHAMDEPLAEVARLLGDLRSAWAEIAPARAASNADLRA